MAQPNPSPPQPPAEVGLPAISVHNIRGLALDRKTPTPYSSSGKYLSLKNATQNVDILALVETQVAENFPAEKFSPFGPRMNMSLYTCPRRSDGGIMVFTNPKSVSALVTKVIQPGRIIRLKFTFETLKYVFYAIYLSAASSIERQMSIDLLTNDIHHINRINSQPYSPPPNFLLGGDFNLDLANPVEGGAQNFLALTQNLNLKNIFLDLNISDPTRIGDGTSMNRMNWSELKVYFHKKA